ncbi:hypothetical protein PGB34_11870 [Xenophilus arseniciresistens]|uniref:Uncharacterized protein n=1 Tax=Xenophilus arseniciresistens TaxID=1283306 RepID=A0AAE3N6V7_9BURK|nr:hypothetical protein [Xenophilus arseniciresistens]MDA7417060.1 hypothetical protein [Xenophilus arseniciresistens]
MQKAPDLFQDQGLRMFGGWVGMAKTPAGPYPCAFRKVTNFSGYGLGYGPGKQRNDPWFNSKIAVHGPFQTASHSFDADERTMPAVIVPDLRFTPE